VIHFAGQLPFINSREAILHGFAINRLYVDDSIVIIAYSVDGFKDLIEQYQLEY